MNGIIEFNPMYRCGGSAFDIIRTLFACAVFLATSGFTVADVELKGNVGSKIIYDNVIIARGSTCVLNGTIINGSIRVLSGAKLYAIGASVIGNVEAVNAVLVDLRDFTEITGDVLANGTQSVLVRDHTQVIGTVLVMEGSASSEVDALLIRNSAVNGDVRAMKCKGRLRVINSTMEGNVRLNKNHRGRYVVHKNQVRKGFQFIGNNGKGSIIENSIGGDLQSRENTPRPIVERNDVSGDVELK